jgi:hypothetical protein
MREIFLRVLTKLRALDPGKLLLAPVGILVVLLVAQGVRYYALARLEKTLIGSLEQAKQELSGSRRADAAELKEYDPITEHGILGTVSKPPPEKLWGIMGENALFGASPDKAKLYKVGEVLSTGEKIVEIGCAEIILEKDGKRRTQSVFPEVKEPARPEKRPAPDRAPGPRAPVAPDSAPKPETKQAPEEPVRPVPPDEEVSAEPEEEDAAPDRVRPERRRGGFGRRMTRERRRREE